MKSSLLLAALLHAAIAAPEVGVNRLPDFQHSLLDIASLKSVSSPIQEHFHLRERSIRHRRSDITKGVRAESKAMHEVVFSVKENLDDLKTLVDDVSNPFSANFGKHLKRHEVTAMTANRASFQHVLAYLSLHEIEVVKTSKYSEYITAVAPVSKWEEVFATEFYEYEVEGEEASKLVRAEQYSLSEHLHDHVSAVFNTVQFPFVTKKRIIREPYVKKTSKKGTTSNSYYGYTVPSLINSVYDIRNNTGNLLGSQCLYESLNQSWSPSDLTIFQQTFDLPIDAVDENINGHMYNGACAASLNDCGEANLDVQTIMAVSQLTPTIVYYDYYMNDFMLDWITDVADMEDPPKVISISYGGPEAFVTESYIEEFNVQALKLSAMGVTLVEASGDDGAPNGWVSYPIQCAYVPDFPGVSYYVTSVGGTMGPETNDPEVACSSSTGGLITSGGGFSNYFATPSWQTDAVASYFTNAAEEGTTPYQGYNAGGRGFPDVSALAHNYLSVLNGSLSAGSGTSASAPVFAGLVALVNAKRLAAGKSTLGWINPSLYALYESFVNDITSGENHCTAHNKICCEQGFTATAGWDPVTGLGSVNYTKFEAVMFALGDNPNIPTEAPSVVPGSPSGAPVKLPTAVPTQAPSGAPTLSSGYLTQTKYSGDACTGNILTMQGLSVGKCFTGYNSDDETTVYWRFDCTSESGTWAIYSDSGCESTIGSFSFQIGCAYENHYYYYGDTYSFSLDCSASSTFPLNDAATFTVASYYDSTTGCSSGDLSAFTAYRNNYCFKIRDYDSSTEYSMKFSYPKQYYYTASSTCAGTKSTNNLPTTCQVDAVDDQYDYYYSYGHIARSYVYSKYTGTLNPTTMPVFTPTLSPDSTQYPSVSRAPTQGPNSSGAPHSPTSSPQSSSAPFSSRSPTRSPSLSPASVSRAPTRSPSRTPTVAPTEAQNYIMSVTQGLNGITATQFLSSDANSQAFAGAVADSLDGIDSGDIVIESVVDAAGASAVTLRRLTTSSVNIAYTIEYNIATLGYSGDPDGAYNNLVSTLDTAVSGTTFNTNLANNAVAYSAPDLTSATTGSVSSSGYTAASTDDDNSSSSKKSGLSQRNKIIIGVVVGVGGFLVLACLIAAGMMMCGRGHSNDAVGGDRAFQAVNTEHAVEVVPVAGTGKETQL